MALFRWLRQARANLETARLGSGTNTNVLLRRPSAAHIPTVTTARPILAVAGARRAVSATQAALAEPPTLLRQALAEAATRTTGSSLLSYAPHLRQIAPR